ncbi:MAG: ribosome small subunit-dependent GTPase A [Fimbriimonadaceae bacterium]|nr:ribosome small subunit-dependent GTPase A [Fimbriimonadaceae bacterium]
MTPQTSEGLVVGSGKGGSWQVQCAAGLLACRLRGRLKVDSALRLEHLVVGDRVLLRGSLDEPECGVVEEVLPRRNQLARGRPGKLPQVVAANLDQVVVVVSVAEPDFWLHTVDRFLIVAAACDVPAVLVLNKIDLDTAAAVRAQVAAVYGPLGLPVVTASASAGHGLAELAAQLAQRVSVVIGPSGVGKSSLLNGISPGYALRTGEVMGIGKGRHTTTDSRLLPLAGGGWVADTPGVKTIALLAGAVAARELVELFPELDPLAADCRFADCTHRSEPDCRVRAAVGAGVAPSRYESYLRLYSELRGGSGA